ncbi:MAG: hypothetical protein Q8R37_04515 [Nanoarchaeota archaeon]|nr:hypothetical protein [Nanoarchaeota archaeon]
MTQLQAMSDKEFIQSLVDAGICDSDGNLRPEYDPNTINFINQENGLETYVLVPAENKVRNRIVYNKGTAKYTVYRLASADTPDVEIGTFVIPEEAARVAALDIQHYNPSARSCDAMYNYPRHRS